VYSSFSSTRSLIQALERIKSINAEALAAVHAFISNISVMCTGSASSSTSAFQLAVRILHKDGKVFSMYTEFHDSTFSAHAHYAHNQVENDPSGSFYFLFCVIFPTFITRCVHGRVLWNNLLWISYAFSLVHWISRFAMLSQRIKLSLYLILDMTAAWHFLSFSVVSLFIHPSVHPLTISKCTLQPIWDITYKSTFGTSQM